MSETPDPIQPGIQIHWREIYDAVVRLTGRVDVMIIQHDERKAEVQDHETRIRALESKQWPLPTLSVVLAAAALILSLIKNFT